ncbi:hypothetical protein C0Q70_10380 [Pomacea canaliculata]|uniref:Band 3 cytoplasmic domain-containing protein n=1 Tax=Pomacea canaliculata TaxID=400727 RepID=A0A2T7PCG7_POMCA|nr:hypothetical protein C0Q70_10380 [Pomacea canaliculata]
MRKSSSMYLNVRMPQKPDRPHVEGEQNEGEESYSICEDSTYDPSTKVQGLLNSVKSLKHRAHTVFCQLSILKKRGDNYEWRESGRWVKYEETVEEGGKRWSKPHVASLSMHYILELRRHLADGVFLRDVECYSVSQVIDKFLDEWVDQDLLDPMLRMHVRTLALKPHRHRHERGRPEDKRKGVTHSASDTVPHSSSVSLEVHGETLKSVNSAISLSSDFGSEQSLESMDSSDLAMKKQLNERFLRKIPKGSETANIMVGELEDLKSVLCGFMRLNDARELGEISEVPLPTRFILYLLGPTGSGVQLREMGRCISTMIVDEIFREVAYKCRDLDDLIAGVDEFVAQVTVLPPGEWDPKIRIEPPNKVPPQEIRKVESTAVLMEKTHGTDGGDEGGHDDPNLELSIRPFTGLIQDIKRKLPWFPSDFKDALHIQCLPATLFIFLALLTNNVTFGALLGTGTGSYMPLNILGSTGPMLVLEKIIYDMCK